MLEGGINWDLGEQVSIRHWRWLGKGNKLDLKWDRKQIRIQYLTQSWESA